MWWAIGILSWLVIAKFTIKIIGYCSSRRDEADKAAIEYFKKENNNAN